jgi:hypothetical protein
MHDTMEQIMELPLPPKEDGIEQALSELDAKLSAWTSAMRGAQEKLRRMLSESADVSTPTSKFSGRVIASARETVPDEISEMNAAPAATPEPVEASIEMERVETPANEVVAPKRHGIRPMGPVVEEEEEESVLDKQRGEDEALLATLEPEVARKIRVIRRLNPEGKSIHELLEEIRVNPAAPEASPPQKKSWFGRKR